MNLLEWKSTAQSLSVPTLTFASVLLVKLSYELLRPQARLMAFVISLDKSVLILASANRHAKLSVVVALWLLTALQCVDA